METFGSLVTGIRTGALAGIEGLAVTAEVDISRGLPGFHLVGLPGAEVRESRERVLAALRHSGCRIPVGKITVNLAPAGIRKEGAFFDLAIAMGIVAAAEPKTRDDQRDLRSGALFIGELSLFGELRPARGLLAIVLAAARMGEKMVVVPMDQAWEAALVEGIQVVGAVNLAQVIRWWRTGSLPQVSASQPGLPTHNRSQGPQECPTRLLAGLEGQPLVRKAAGLAATGGLGTASFSERGRQTVKTVPWPGWLSTTMNPSCCLLACSCCLWPTTSCSPPRRACSWLPGSSWGTIFLQPPARPASAASRRLSPCHCSGIFQR